MHHKFKKLKTNKVELYSSSSVNEYINSAFIEARSEDIVCMSHGRDQGVSEFLKDATILKLTFNRPMPNKSVGAQNESNVS